MIKLEEAFCNRGFHLWKEIDCGYLLFKKIGTELWRFTYEKLYYEVIIRVYELYD